MQAINIAKLTMDAVGFYGLPLVYGFSEVSSNLTQSNAISILTYLNKRYAKLVETGFLKCFRTMALAEGEKELRLDGSFLNVHSIRLIDGDEVTGTSYRITRKSVMQMDSENQTIYYGQKFRPTSCYITGGLIIFDKYADADYTIKMLCDVEPSYMTIATEEPTRLANVLHYVLADGAAYDISRLALNKPENRTPFNIARHGEIKEEWLSGFNTVKKLADSSQITDSAFTNIVDTYRNM